MSNVLGGAGGTGPADNRPLTDQEFQLVQRLLSDPLSFPLEFKSWLVGYLETSDLTLPMNAVLGLQKTLGITGAGEGTLGILPAGLIFPYGGTSAPTGAVMCDGRAYSRAAEPRLYAAIQTNYGAPDANSFYVPDMQGRVPVGRGSHSSVDTLGKNEGAAAGNRRPHHNHSVAPATAKVVDDTNSGPSAFSGGWAVNQVAVGPPDAPTDTGAFVVVNFIIIR